MNSTRQKFLMFCFLYCCFISVSFADADVLNIYNWSGYIPSAVLIKFKKETGVTIHYSTFDNNEQLYNKLKADPNSDYDIVVPTTYFVARMINEDMLKKLNKSKLPNLKNIDPQLLNRAFDPGNQYSVPYLWGSTSIIINTKYYQKKDIDSWASFWSPKFQRKIAMMDDVRDVFSVAFLYLGYSINDEDPTHINQGYFELKKLLPNVLTFNADGSQQMFINEDANIGMVNNGDALSIISENSSFEYIYPKEGPLLWFDNMVIPKNAKHVNNAYKFMNFVMRPDVAKLIADGVSYASPNLAARKLMSKSVRNNPILYPPESVLKKAQVESAVSDKTNALYLKYWEMLKLGGSN